MEKHKLQRIGSGVHYLTIPEKYRKALGWEKGDYVTLELDGDRILLSAD